MSAKLSSEVVNTLKPRKAVIAGTGRALPSKLVRSEAFDAKFGQAPGTLEQKTGVASRFVCDAESQIDLAAAACRAAMADARCTADNVELIICASAVPYQTIPGTAPRVMAELGIADGQGAGFDVNSTCLSFLNATNIAAHMVTSGQYTRVLVVSSEIASRALPWDTDPETAALFGDGAAAAVIEAGPKQDQGLGPMLMRTYPSAYEASALKAGGTRLDYHNAPDVFAEGAHFTMDGGVLFRLTAKHFGRFVEEVLERYSWSRQDVACVIPHQASPAALEHMIRHTGFDKHRVVNIAQSHGNQIAASIPFALDVARKEHRIAPGHKVLMLGTSAGVSFGGLGYVA